MKQIYFFIVGAFLCVNLCGQSFTKFSSGLGIEGTVSGDIEAFDFDRDNDLDVIVTGTNASGTVVTKLYKNTGTLPFTEVTSTGLPAMRWGEIDIVDVDNDGFLDLCIGGYSGSIYRTYVYENNSGNGTFSHYATFSNYARQFGAWGDSDNDGDMDYIISGFRVGAGSRETHLYINNGDGTFTQSSNSFIGAEEGSADWGDIDNDGDNDLMITGEVGSTTYGTYIYENEGSNVFSLKQSLLGRRRGDAKFEDFDDDGDIDLAVFGYASSNGGVFYENNGSGTFSVSAYSGYGEYIDLEWLDFDNDGDADMMHNAHTGAYLLYTHRNNSSGSFTTDNEGSGTGLHSLSNFGGGTAIGDFDSDGDIDIIINGSSDASVSGATAYLYRNDESDANTRPSNVTGLSASQSGYYLNVGWDKATDSETSQNGLTYHLGWRVVGDSYYGGNRGYGFNSETHYCDDGNQGHKNKTYILPVDTSVVCPGETVDILLYVFAVDNGYLSSDVYGITTVSYTVPGEPTVTVCDFADICESSDPLTLTGGAPLGGTFSGTAVSGGVFNPGSAGNGTHTLTYNYTLKPGCVYSANTSIKVLDAPANRTITPATTQYVCSGDSVELAISSVAGADYVWHETTATDEWNYVGDPGFDAGGGVAFGINNQGEKFVAYQDDSESGKLSVRKWNGTNWVSIGDGISDGDFTTVDITFDSDGNPYVAYRDHFSSSFAITVRRYTGFGWSTVGSARFTSLAQYPDIELDCDNTPYVAFRDITESNKISVMKYSASTWSYVGGAGISSGSVTYPNLEIRNGNPVVAYTDADQSSQLSVQYYNGTSWEHATNSPGIGSSSANYVSAEIDRENNLLVAYMDGGNSGKLTVIRYDGSTWSTMGAAGFSNGAAGHIQLKVDNENTPFVAYRDNSYSVQRAVVSKFNGSAWETVGTPGYSAGMVFDNYIDFDANNTPWVGYDDNTNSGPSVLKLGKKPLSNANNYYAKTAATYRVTYFDGSGCSNTSSNIVQVQSQTQAICDEPKFITVWDLSTGGNVDDIEFKCATGGTVNYEWEEISPGSASGTGTFSGTSATISGLPNGAKVRLKIKPENLERFYIDGGADKDRLVDVENWGDAEWTSMEDMFYECTNLDISATDIPDLSNLTRLSNMFWKCSSLEFNASINNWVTDNVNLMNGMFYAATLFNQPLNGWNTDAVTHIGSMFQNATSFNQPLNNWNTENVTTLAGIFYNAKAFNGDISNWNVEKVSNFAYTVYLAENFNQSLEDWNLKGATNISVMIGRSGMDCENYTATLKGWSENLETPSGLALGASLIKYGTETVPFRQKLIDDLSWTFVDQASSLECTNGGNFITEWNMVTSGSGSDQITFNAETDGDVSYVWETVPSGFSGSGVFNRATPGAVTIAGLPSNRIIRLAIDSANLERFYIQNGADRNRLTDVEQWGTANWTSMEYAFHGCANLQVSATDIPNLSSLSSIGYMFYNCTNLTGPANIGLWNVSSVTGMAGTFNGAQSFNQDISGWNTSAVSNMGAMFSNAMTFNQDLGGWDVSGVGFMGNMFRSASSFNQNLGDWDLSSMTSVSGFFTSSGMSCTNYSATLIGWAENPSTPSNKFFGPPPVNYGTNAVDAKEYLDVDLNWTFTPGGDDLGSDASGCYTPEFITLWDLSYSGTGSNNEISFYIDVATATSVNYTWRQVPSGAFGSGSIFADGLVTISGLPANQTIRLKLESPNLERFYIDNNSNRSRLIEVQQWGNSEWLSMESMFYGCNNLTIPSSTIDIPDIDFCTTLDEMFRNCFSLNGPTNIGSWDVDQVQGFKRMFQDASAFNQPLNSWNVVQAEDMRYMFDGASSFNQPLFLWNTGNVGYMTSMFDGASVFNGSIGNWNTSSVSIMSRMFAHADKFNQDISNWNTSDVTSMSYMFYDADEFNQYLGDWDLSSINTSGAMLKGALSLSGMQCDVYSATLEGWAINPSTPSGIELGATDIEYGTNVDGPGGARTYLDVDKGWTFVDDAPSGVVCALDCNYNLSVSGDVTPCEGDALDLIGTASWFGTFNYKWLKPDNSTVAGVDLDIASVTNAIDGDYYFLAFQEGCWDSLLTEVVVVSDPGVSFANLANVCEREPAFTLTGGAPVGGTYSGAGVSSGVFDPAAAGDGTHSLNYSVSNSGCTFVASSNQTVTEACKIIWDGGAGTAYWEQAANWNFDEVPTAIDSVYVDETLVAGSYTVEIGNTNPTVKYIKVGANQNLDIDSSLTVTHRIDNQGTVDVYDYASFIQTSGSVLNNSGNMKHLKIGKTGGDNYNYWSSPVVSGTLEPRTGSSTGMLQGKYMYAFQDGKNQRDDYVRLWSGGPMVVGRSYAISDGRTAIFEGTFNNGNVFYPLALNGAPAPANPSYNLLGNPYPSTIHAAALMAHNGGLGILESGTVFIFDQCNANTQTFVASDEFIAINASGTNTTCSSGGTSALDLNDTYIPSTQGFFVEAKHTGTGTFEFTNAMRGRYNSGLKSDKTRISKALKKAGYPSEEILNGAVKLKVTLIDQDQKASATLLSMLEDATEEHDFWYDSKAVVNGAIARPSVFTQDKEGYEHLLQGIPHIVNKTEVVPVSVAVEKSKSYVFSFDETKINETGLYAILKDNALGRYHLISNGEYGFVAAQSGLVSDRFEILFMHQITGEIADYFEVENARVYYSSQALHLEGSIQKVQVLDVLGKTVLEHKKPLTGTSQLSVSLTSGIYLVNLTTNGGIKTTRVFVD